MFPSWTRKRSPSSAAGVWEFEWRKGRTFESDIRPWWSSSPMQELGRDRFGIPICVPGECGENSVGFRQGAMKKGTQIGFGRSSRGEARGKSSEARVCAEMVFASSTMRSVDTCCRENGGRPVCTEARTQRQHSSNHLQQFRMLLSVDVLRRLVSFTIAQQLGPAVERANALLHFALSTRGASALGMHCKLLNGARQPPSRGLMGPARTTQYLAPSC